MELKRRRWNAVASIPGVRCPGIVRTPRCGSVSGAGCDDGQPAGGEVGAEASGDPFRSVVGEHGTYVDAETSERLDDVVDETDGVAGGDGPDDDEDDRPAGGDVDGGQLVHLADALEVADVKAVGRHQVAGRRAVVAEPERLGVAAGFGGQ